MANVESSSSASIAPLAAMMRGDAADRRSHSEQARQFRRQLKGAAQGVHRAAETARSRRLQAARLIPPSFSIISKHKA